MLEHQFESVRQAIMTMEVVAGDETMQIFLNEEMPEDVLAQGPYAVSPLRGLYFHNASDTATS